MAYIVLGYHKYFKLKPLTETVGSVLKQNHKLWFQIQMLLADTECAFQHCDPLLSQYSYAIFHRHIHLKLN